MRKVIKSRIDFLSNLVTGKRVLDIGCVNHSAAAARDPSWLHASLKRTAKHVTGIDYDADAVSGTNAEKRRRKTA